MAARILVVGLGNILLQDDGLGVRATERLRAGFDLPAHVECLDGGTLGLELLAYLAGVTHLLVADAVETGGLAGTLRRLEGDEIRATLTRKISMHQVDLLDTLALGRLQGSLPATVVVWGMQPASTEVGLSMSPAVAGQLDTLVECLVQELRDWGVAVVRSAPDDEDADERGRTRTRPEQ